MSQKAVLILKDDGGGMTNRSLRFLRHARNKISIITHVEVKDMRETRWPLRLRDVHHNEIWLSGCTSGFPGEGPRTTFQILKDLGFEVKLTDVVTLQSFVLDR